MTYCVRTVTALNLRVGDTVIPDHGPHRRVTLHRLEGAHPVVVVQYEGVPGSSVYYPPSMPLLVEADGSGPECRSSRRIPRPAVQTPSQTGVWTAGRGILRDDRHSGPLPSASTSSGIDGG